MPTTASTRTRERRRRGFWLLRQCGLQADVRPINLFLLLKIYIDTLDLYYITGERFVSKYRSIVTGSGPASSEPPRTPLFGGTPLSDGVFDVEEERHLPIALRVIRWAALGWAVYILGREAYFFFSR